MVSVIRHIQLSNMGPVAKWSDKWHSTVSFTREPRLATFMQQEVDFQSIP